jgi:hypothetical protein
VEEDGPWDGNRRRLFGLKVVAREKDFEEPILFVSDEVF